ncbi:PH domain-containing protein [Jeotgalicoccus sp. ATCC 8456]|uniref:PH domain-containing protein n=1 Tax=Jeotgalicoccus sp. ATCC 8456 TaxID=946435 RepID=UPI001F18E351|nr:PH domain-containing protein [Jeotgalicoccus sp. ATCC 8456]
MMKRISPKAIKLWRIRALINAGIWFVIALAIGIATFFFDFIPWWIFLIPVGLGLLVLLISAWITPKLKYKYFRYQVLEDEIRIHSGIWFKSEVSVPFFRVQNIDTTVGPIMKKMSLKGISLQTSAERLYIPELENQKADELRSDIRTLINRNSQQKNAGNIL